jgi:pimeloyl-ACP methyl ester carboxylesterase
MHLTESSLLLLDGDSTFTVTLIAAEEPAGVVFFAAGRGGSPLRHLGLLRAVAKHGYTVVAPHFDLLPLSAPTQKDLDTRIRRLNLALQQYASINQPIFGIGHSLGCVVLLVLAGAKARTRSGHEVASDTQWNFDGLALLAPAVDFFRHPDASLNIDARIHLRAGNQDTIITPDRVLDFKEMLPDLSKVEFYLDEDAGHFSYMDELPPNVEDCQPNRQTFLSVLAEEVGAFISSKP